MRRDNACQRYVALARRVQASVLAEGEAGSSSWAGESARLPFPAGQKNARQGRQLAKSDTNATPSATNRVKSSVFFRQLYFSRTQLPAAAHAVTGV